MAAVVAAVQKGNQFECICRTLPQQQQQQRHQIAHRPHPARLTQFFHRGIFHLSTGLLQHLASRAKCCRCCCYQMMVMSSFGHIVTARKSEDVCIHLSADRLSYNSSSSSQYGTKPLKRRREEKSVSSMTKDRQTIFC